MALVAAVAKLALFAVVAEQAQFVAVAEMALFAVVAEQALSVAVAEMALFAVVLNRPCLLRWLRWPCLRW